MAQSKITEEENEDGQMEHLKFDFLKPEKIKDASGRRPSHPDYDSRTLFVPTEFMEKQTPGHKQWQAFTTSSLH